MPEISVVMSVYNGEKYLCEAIDSILNQTFKDFEFIIIDDGSTDNTTQILCSYDDSRIKLLAQNNMGLAKSLNRGIREARGKYIARMDADDISHPDRLRQQVKFMDNHPECVALGTQTTVMRENGIKIYVSQFPLDDQTLKAGLPAKCPFFHGSVMFCRDEAIYCGGYPELYCSQDVVFWNKISKRGEFRNLPSALYFYRIVQGQITMYSWRTSRRLTEITSRMAKSDSLNKNDIELVASLCKKENRISREANYYRNIGKRYLEYTDDLKNARRFLFKAVFKAPLMWNAWFNLLLCFLPQDKVRVWKNRKMGWFKAL